MLVSAFLDATSHQLWERQVVWCPSALLEQYVVGRAKTFRGLPTAGSAPFSATPFRTVIARMPVSTRSFFRVLTHDQVSPGSNVELASSSLTVAVRYRSDLRSSSASTCRLQPARRRHCRSAEPSPQSPIRLGYFHFRKFSPRRLAPPVSEHYVCQIRPKVQVEESS